MFQPSLTEFSHLWEGGRQLDPAFLLQLHSSLTPGLFQQSLIPAVTRFLMALFWCWTGQRSGSGMSPELPLNGDRQLGDCVGPGVMSCHQPWQVTRTSCRATGLPLASFSFLSWSLWSSPCPVLLFPCICCSPQNPSAKGLGWGRLQTLLLFMMLFLQSTELLILN